LPARLLRDVGGALVATTLVSCVVMTSMVVGPFYLTIALGLDATRTGLVMSIGSVVAALTGVPAGRLVDRVGAKPATLVGLAGMSAGALAFSLRPEHLGVAGYVAPMAALTASYALFTAANNTGVMQRASASERGVASGTLSLARNAGLVAGACVMGAAFAFGAGVPDVALASAHAVARGLRTTYALAAVLVALAFAVVSLTKGERS
jgi:MFS family permease